MIDYASTGAEQTVTCPDCHAVYISGLPGKGVKAKTRERLQELVNTFTGFSRRIDVELNCLRHDLDRLKNAEKNSLDAEFSKFRAGFIAQLEVDWESRVRQMVEIELSLREAAKEMKSAKKKAKRPVKKRAVKKKKRK